MNKVIFFDRSNTGEDFLSRSDMIHLMKYFQLYHIPYVLHLEKESIGCLASPWIKLLEKYTSEYFKPMRPFGIEKVYQISVRLTSEQYKMMQKKFEHIMFAPLKGIEEGYRLFNDIWCEERREISC